jgi:cell division transport system permease protein
MSTNVEAHAKKGLKSSYVSTIIGISLVLFMIGIVIAGMFGINTIQKNAKESLQVDIFFSISTNEADVKQIEMAISGWKEILEVQFISSTRALELLGEDGLAAEELKELFNDDNPIPASISFRPKAEFANTEGINKISDRLKIEYPSEISEISYDKNSVKSVNLGFRNFVLLALIVAGLLSIIAFAMINNTIRLALYSQRFSIKTMQLVGATNRFIRKPFLMKAILQGIVSAIIGMALLLALFIALDAMSDLFKLAFEWKTFVIIFVSMIIIGIVLSTISTWLALSKYLRVKLDDLY